VTGTQEHSLALSLENEWMTWGKDPTLYANDSRAMASSKGGVSSDMYVCLDPKGKKESLNKMQGTQYCRQ
jgi:hypothetical protein